MKREDLHIKILKYGAANRDDGFTFNELKKDLKLTELQERFLYREIRGADIVTQTGTYRIPGNGDSGNEILILSFEARFKLLQHQALQEARFASIIAIFVAVIAILVAIGVGFYQIYTPQQVELTKDQLNILTPARY